MPEFWSGQGVGAPPTDFGIPTPTKGGLAGELGWQAESLKSARPERLGNNLHW